MLGFCTADTTGRGPEAVVMAGRTRLRNERVVTINTIGDRAAAEDNIVVLPHRGSAGFTSPVL